jgi:serine/threonine protein phosphatase PrpC
MIQTDTFLKIGKTHQVCEDYIISGDIPTKYVILSDGCSSSKQTEMGARILCHLAKQYLLYRKDDYRFPTLSYAEMGAWIIHNAELTARQLGLTRNCLDATLIIAYEFDGLIYIYMYGDGVIVTQSTNGMIGVMEIEFNQNAPYYLSYKIDPERMDSFHKMGQHLIIKSCFGDVNNENRYAYDYKTRFTYQTNLFPKITICSDGLSSFMKGTDPEQTIEIAKEFLAYKSTKGEFLKRRLKRATKLYEADGIFHNDDLSVGAFLYEED